MIITRPLIVGDWIKRDKRGAPHLVESIVAGDVVTKCGRRMKDEPNADGPLMLALYERRCRVCAHPGDVQTFSTSSDIGTNYTYTEST